MTIEPTGRLGLPVLVSQGIAGPNGLWSLTSNTLADASYTIVGLAVATDGSRLATVLTSVDRPLVIDTAGPRVLGVQVDPRHGRVSIIYADALSGLDPRVGQALPNAYVFRRGIARRLQSYSVTGVSSSIGRLPTDPITETITIDGGRRIGPGHRYLLRVESARVTDRAGNPLDGAFTGTYPSGTGSSGSDFAVRLVIRGGRVSERPVDRPGLVLVPSVVRTARHPRGPITTWHRSRS